MNINSKAAKIIPEKKYEISLSKLNIQEAVEKLQTSEEKNIKQDQV